MSKPTAFIINTRRTHSYTHLCSSSSLLQISIYTLVKKMEINMTRLCDLDLMLNDAKILARVISIWKSHPKQRPNEVWSLDVVLQDQMGNRVQATVRNHDIKKFQPILDEGACYRISNLGIGENSGNFPLLEHRFKLSFFKNTALTRVGSFDSNLRGFRFEHFSAFTSRKFSKRELSDVIGTIVSISDAIPFNYVGVDKIRRTVILEDYEGARHECCFFYSWSDKFTKLYDERDKSEKPSVTPAMYSTKLYINNDIPEIAAFRKRENYDWDVNLAPDFKDLQRRINSSIVISRNAGKELVKHELQTYSHSGKDEVKEEKGTRGKRSCRKRLHGHNRRKRKPHADTSRAASVFSSHQVREANGQRGGGLFGGRRTGRAVSQVMNVPTVVLDGKDGKRFL
ncbi:replication protein A 70 kDa DNA-binding subunit B [Tanacetum coccineum]